MPPVASWPISSYLPRRRGTASATFGYDVTATHYMPRLAILIGFLGGCFFDAGYSGGTVKCSDGRCPSGLVCHLETCVTSIPIDMGHDIAIDAPPAALNCASPGPFPTTGGMAAGTTVGATSKMSSACGGFVMNGPDRVYAIPMDG